MNETHKVLPRRTTELGNREMAQAGARFETYVRAAMAEAGLPTMAELYRQSGIGASTWGAWFNGQRQPRGNSLRLAGAPLNLTPEQLRAVYEGDRPPKPRRATETPDDLVTALRDQTEAMNALVARLDTFVGPLGEMMAELLRDELRAAKARRSSGAATS